MSYNCFLVVLLLLIHFQTSTTACGGNLLASDDAKELTSPNYPEMYSANTDCVWRIISRRSAVYVTITNWDLERGSYCQFDLLEIYYDGTSYALCGNSSGPRSYVSQSKVVFIIFQSDDSVHHNGFRLTYQSAKAIPACLGKVENLTANSEYQILQGPEYTASTSSEINCQWTIEAERGYIEINVEEYDIDATTLCSAGSLDIYNARDDSFPVASLCGSSTKKANLSVSTQSNKSYVRLHYDSTVSHRHFKLGYKLVEEPLENPDCLGGLTRLMASNTEQVLTSPGYPSDYPDLLNCIWRIESPLELIEVTVADFSLHQCSNDTLVISDFFNEGQIAALRGRSDERQQRVFLSHANITFIHFYSDDSGADRGFRLTYKAVKSDIRDLESRHRLLFYIICALEFLIIVAITTGAIICWKKRARQANQKTENGRDVRSQELTLKPGTNQVDSQGYNKLCLSDEEKDTVAGNSYHVVPNRLSPNTVGGPGFQKHKGRVALLPSSNQTIREPVVTQGRDEQTDIYENYASDIYENA